MTLEESLTLKRGDRVVRLGRGAHPERLARVNYVLPPIPHHPKGIVFLKYDDGATGYVRHHRIEREESKR